MTSRIDPITPAQWKVLRASLRPVVERKHFGTTTARDYAFASYGVVFDALWETGAHPSVFADPVKNRVAIKNTPTGWEMHWRRPKTKRLCIMPITPNLARDLNVYLNVEHDPQFPLYTTRSLLRVMRECSEEAGIKDVTPKTIRHTVAYNLFKAHGPSVAKESLGVSDRVLQDYMALSAETRVRVIRDGRKGVPEVHPPLTQALREKEGSA